MHVYIRKDVYIRIKEYSKYLGKSLSQIVEESLTKTCGMEGIPIEDEDAYGKKQDENK